MSEVIKGYAIRRTEDDGTVSHLTKGMYWYSSDPTEDYAPYVHEESAIREIQLAMKKKSFLLPPQEIMTAEWDPKTNTVTVYEPALPFPVVGGFPPGKPTPPPAPAP